MNEEKTDGAAASESPDYAGTVAEFPDVDRDHLEVVMRDFDASRRVLPEWANWESKKSHKYAVEWKGQRYPVKEIVRTATGVRLTFTPGPAHEYLRKRGFEIVSLPGRGTPSKREDLDSARTVLEEMFKEEDVRRQCLSIVAASIITAHKVNPTGWGISLFDCLIRLNVGRIQAICLCDKVVLALDRRTLPSQIEQSIIASMGTIQPGFSSLPDSVMCDLPPKETGAILKAIQAPHDEILLRASSAVKRTPYARAHSPGVLAYMREFLRLDHLPDPDYTVEVEASTDSSQLMPSLSKLMSARGLRFGEWEIATFFTALQVKGFTILSGISGTGKTKLAQHFAELMPQPARGILASAKEVIAITIHPYMLNHGQIYIPKQQAHRLPKLELDERVELRLQFGEETEIGRLAFLSYSGGLLQLGLRKNAKHWLADHFTKDDRLILDPQFGPDDKLTGFRMSNEQELAVEDPAMPRGQNWLFLSVRPDWRDSKSLLGYYNPLTETYQSTEFLRFLIRASQSFKSGEQVAWFVILDEMNLARVEYYLADLLSVLESGRDQEGWTCEPLRLEYPDDVEGDLPPKEIKLPPNLYLVGTVNMDETTHPFSAKVLDRAFTLELTEADFSNYPAAIEPQSEPNPEGRQVLFKLFTRDGKFAGIDKERLVEFVETHLELRDRLQILNQLLRPHQMHFGYRVFDEVVTFVDCAEENGLLTTEEAFDAAVFMKVLPKFHGSRGKLEQPLLAILDWCLSPGQPGDTFRKTAFDSVESIEKAISNPGWVCSRTAGRVFRMLRHLLVDGFTAFG